MGKPIQYEVSLVQDFVQKNTHQVMFVGAFTAVQPSWQGKVYENVQGRGLLPTLAHIGQQTMIRSAHRGVLTCFLCNKRRHIKANC